MTKRKHPYSSAGPHDEAPAVGELDKLLENTGNRNRASFGVAQAEKTHTRKEIKQVIRQNIRQARSGQRG
jgi:hypothetical protein